MVADSTHSDRALVLPAGRVGSVWLGRGSVFSPSVRGIAESEWVRSLWLVSLLLIIRVISLIVG